MSDKQFSYSADTIGNRLSTRSGGDTNGANLRPANYSVNSLNQITQRDVPGTNDIIGAALLYTNVTVNGVAADRKIEYFHGTVGTNNASHPAWLTSTAVGAGSSVTGNLYVAQTPEHFQYDADGNLTNDGRWAYTWDAENRLVGMTVNTNVGPQYQLTFAFDFQGRRIQKIVATNNGSAFVTVSTYNFLYDGWNLIAETAPNNSLIRNYVWGTDLSGSAQGAGGVGGLLEVSYHGSSITNAFVAYDGNGNVSALVNVADGTMLANYEYSPFGETIRSTGSLAKNNPFRFSTKYDDDESDFLYYGYRCYKPSTGTWLSRDPIAEEGGLNQTTFADNSPLNYIDLLGNLGAPATPSADGFLTITVKKPARAIGNCGGAYYVVSWQVSGSSDGYVMQHFKQTVNVTDCQGHGVASQNASEEFTEAWQFTGGSWPMGHNDTFSTKSEGSGRKGTILDIGRVKFMKNYALTIPPWGKNLPGTDAGILPVIKPTPPGWTDVGSQIHAMFIIFDCCCNATEQIATLP